jgi:hypothetical protein
MTRSARLRGLGLIVAVAAVAALAACFEPSARNPTVVPSPTTVATAEPTSTPTVTPTATATTPPASPTATATTGPTATPSPLPVSNVDPYDLYLLLEGVGDENVVYGSIMVLRGRTLPDAILSINGVIVEVDADGRFEREIRLDPGLPSVIEIVASDLTGNQMSAILSVVSLPLPEEEV